VLFLVVQPPPGSPLFPYTTLFRSAAVRDGQIACMGCLPHARVFLRSLTATSHLLEHDDDSKHETCLGRRGGFSGRRGYARHGARSEEHTSELQSRENLVCRLLLEK